MVLPGSSFAEKDGTFVNTERRIQLSRKAVDPPGEARCDLDILIDLSHRLGLPTPYATRPRCWTRSPRVTPTWRGVSHGGSASATAGCSIRCRRRRTTGRDFLFDDQFPTPDGRAQFVPVEYLPPAELPDAEYPFLLNTGRQMYHWHTGTMTRRSPALDSREPARRWSCNPADAADLGVSRRRDGARSPRGAGSIRIAVRLSERVAHGQVFVPMHYREAAANLLTNPALDPCGDREFKVCAVRIERID